MIKQTDKWIEKFDSYLEDENPEHAREMGRVDLTIKELKRFISSLLDEAREEIWDDWEIAIRFSQKDEDDVPVEKRNLSEEVMVNHLKGSKENLESLAQKEEK